MPIYNVGINKYKNKWTQKSIIIIKKIKGHINKNKKISQINKNKKIE